MDNLELIEKYLQKKLSESEITEFNEKLNTDSEFRKEFEIIKNMESVLHETEKNRIECIINKTAHEYEASAVKRIIRQRIYFSVAAVLLILISIPVIFKLIRLQGPDTISQRILQLDTQSFFSNIGPVYKLDTSKIKENNDADFYRTFIVKRFGLSDSESFGFLPDETGEYKLKVMIIHSKDNTYKLYNKNLVLKSTVDYEDLKLYEEMNKFDTSYLYMKIEDKVYRLEQTITYKKPKQIYE